MVFNRNEQLVHKNRNPSFGGDYYHPYTLSEDKMMDAADKIARFLLKENVSIRDALWILDVTKERVLDFPFNEVNTI